MLSAQDPEDVELLRRNAERLEVFPVVIFHPASRKNQVNGCLVEGAPELGCLDFVFNFHLFKKSKKIVHSLFRSFPKTMDYQWVGQL